MKYNDPIIISENEAHTIILKQIMPQSKVLEFGSANGRMTKILAQDLRCSVYIVEYEREAFNEAMEFAEEGICEDIEQLGWKSKWSDKKFDYIIFADVLEHLTKPYEILSNTEELLKADGKVLISVPNIAHNDILIKLYNQHFDYTGIGILDNTHVHFFAKENLIEFEKKTGYKICTIDYKTLITGMTEQFKGKMTYTSSEMKALLLSRKDGEVYQFILTLMKAKYVKANAIHVRMPEEIVPQLEGRIYFDRGNGYSQTDGVQVYSVVYDTNNCELKLKLAIDENIVAIRYDPIEGQPCLIYYSKASINNVELVMSEVPNYNIIKEGKLLTSGDPKIIWKCQEKSKTEIIIHVKFSIDRDVILKCMQGIIDVAKQKEMEQRNVNRKEAERKEKEKEEILYKLLEQKAELDKIHGTKIYRFVKKINRIVTKFIK